MSLKLKILFSLWFFSSTALIPMDIFGIDSEFRLYYSNAGQVSTSFAAALFCFGTSRAFPYESELRKVWGAIGSGLLAWALGTTIFAAYPLLHDGQDTPYPYFSDIGYLLASPLMTIGLLLFKRSAGLITSARGKIFASLSFVSAGLLAYHANAPGLVDPNPFTSLTALCYAVFDPILIGTIALIASSFRGGAVGKSWQLLILGILLYYAANQLYTYLVMLDRYTTGDAIDVGWLLGFGVIAYAAAGTRRLAA